MRWRQPNASLARISCHQSSWVWRSAFLKYEDLIELTPSPRADGWEHSVRLPPITANSLVTLIAPPGPSPLLADLTPRCNGPFPGPHLCHKDTHTSPEPTSSTSPPPCHSQQLLSSGGFQFVQFVLLSSQWRYSYLAGGDVLNTLSFLGVYISVWQHCRSLIQLQLSCLPTHWQNTLWIHKLFWIYEIRAYILHIH